MKSKLVLVLVTIITCSNIFSQIRKIDTTLLIGKAGYKITCNNKSPEKNLTTVKPIGFDNGAREVEFYARGRLQHAEIDDFNNDGFPDVVIFSYGGPGPKDYVSVFAIASAENKSFVPVLFPDLLDDAKLRDGYKGHDVFSLMEGTILRTFPLFKADDVDDKPTGGKRVVQYKMIPSEGGNGYKFKVFRTYEIKG